MNLVQKMFKGDKRALTRLITLIENQSPFIFELMPKIYRKTGKAQIIGITGPPGAGKSTLIDQLIKLFRHQKKQVAILAIDPSSPFSGGAVLGDRIRMQSHAGDSSVFIRSVGSRVSHGGLSRATKEIVRLFDAFGFDIIIVETVGVGQTELSIMEIAQTTVVVLVPESGDTIQTMKAGLLEIANIFVVNKSDRPDSSELKRQLSEMTSIPILQTQAIKDVGTQELWEKIKEHSESLKKNNKELELKRKAERRGEFLEIVTNEYEKKLKLASHTDKFLKKLFSEVEEGSKDPYSAALEVINKNKSSID